MIVDWHAHVYPPELAKERRWDGASPLTIENLLEAHEKAGIDLCVVSNTIHYLKDKTPTSRWHFCGAGTNTARRSSRSTKTALSFSPARCPAAANRL